MTVLQGIIAVFMALMIVSPSLADVAVEETMIQYCGPNNDMCVPQPCGPNDIDCYPQLDVVFVIDSTGSMSDEIRTVKTHLLNIMEQVKEGRPSPRVRVGVVTYRDHKPEENDYITRKMQLTYSHDKVVDFIEDIEARGGGDYAEAVADGLDEAIEMNWNQYARKLVFLVGDAAPHGEQSQHYDRFPNGCPEGHTYQEAIRNANKQGITIHTVSGSGMDSAGLRIWQQIARETGGQYESLVYVRKAVDVYFAEENIDEKYMDEAIASADYDQASNSILTNTLGRFSAGVMKAEAMDMGVVYEDDPQPETPVVDTPVDNQPDQPAKKGFYAFIKSMLSRFWLVKIN